MANTLGDIAALYEEPQFRRLVAASLVKQAIVVRTESVGTANHAARSDYALRVLTNAEDFINTFLRVLSALSSVVTPYNSTTHAMPTDTVIDAAVAGVWDNLSVP